MAAKPPDAFLSYTRFDDRHDGGAISEFCRRLASAVQAVTGAPFNIFQDVEGIGIGEHWPGKLDQMLDETRFFIPILTPSYFTSKACRDELLKFLSAEAKRGREDLVLPIYYIECDLLEEEDLRASDSLASTIHERQRQDWRERRFEPFGAPAVRRALEQLAREIVRALRRPASAPPPQPVAAASPPTTQPPTPQPTWIASGPIGTAPARGTVFRDIGQARIVIATAGPMTGPYAVFGDQMKRGAEMAIKDLNVKGGVLGEQLRLEVGDDACDPKQAVAVANQFVNKGVVFVAGHFCSGSSIPASAVYHEEGILQISPGSPHPMLTEQGFDNVFRVCGRDDQQGQVAADYVVDNKVGSAIAVLHDRTAYGKGLADTFKKQLNARGVQEAMYEAIAADDKDFTALITRMKNAGIDLIYLGGYHNEAGLITRQAHEQGLSAQMVSGDALVTKEYWAITGDTGQGTLMTFSPDPRKNETAAEVVQEFETAGYDPEGYTLYTYAAIQVWAQAAEQAGSTDLDAVVEQLHGNQFETVLGTISFDDKGDVEGASYVMYKWDNGSYAEVSGGSRLRRRGHPGRRPASAPAPQAVADIGQARIVIATAGPMTGQYAVFGEQMKRGAEMAIKDLNAKGGVLGEQLRLEVGDDACDPKQAVAVANQFVNKGVVFVAGHFLSGPSISASAVYHEEGILQISPAASHPMLTEQGFDNVFRVCGRDDQQGTFAGNYVVDNHVGSRIAVLHDRTAYGKGLADEFKKQLNARGVEEAMYEAITAGDKDFTALITRMKNAGVDLIYLGGYHTEAGLIARQAKEQGINVTMVSGDALVTDEYWAITGDTGQGTLMTFSPDPRKNEAAQPLVAEFQAQGFDPKGYTLYTYAAIQAWAQAVEKAGSTDLEPVEQALHQNQFETVLGTLGFDDKGDVKRASYVMYKWDNGSFVEVSG